MAYPDVSQILYDEIYPVRISTQKSLIKVAICEIHGMKWGGQALPKFTLGAWSPGPPPKTIYGGCRMGSTYVEPAPQLAI